MGLASKVRAIAEEHAMDCGEEAEIEAADLRAAAQMLESFALSADRGTEAQIAFKCADICEQALHDHADEPAHVGRVHAIAGIRKYAESLRSAVPSARPIKRYLVDYHDQFSMKEYERGEWVKYEDIEHLLARSSERDVDELVERHTRELQALKDRPASFERLVDMLSQHYNEMTALARQASARSATRDTDALVNALLPFAVEFLRHGERYQKAGSDWFEKMPAEWPINLTVSMQNGRDAVRLAMYRAQHGRADG